MLLEAVCSPAFSRWIDLGHLLCLDNSHLSPGFSHTAKISPPSWERSSSFRQAAELNKRKQVGMPGWTHPAESMVANTVHSFSQSCYEGLIHFRARVPAKAMHTYPAKSLSSLKWLRKALREISRRAVIVQLLSHHLTLCDPRDCSPPGFPIFHHLPEFAQTHIHVSDAIQPSHPLSPPSHLPSIFLSNRVFPMS